MVDSVIKSAGFGNSNPARSPACTRAGMNDLSGSTPAFFSASVVRGASVSASPAKPFAPKAGAAANNSSVLASPIFATPSSFRPCSRAVMPSASLVPPLLAICAVRMGMTTSGAAIAAATITGPIGFVTVSAADSAALAMIAPAFRADPLVIESVIVSGTPNILPTGSASSGCGVNPTRGNCSGCGCWPSGMRVASLVPWYGVKRLDGCGVGRETGIASPSCLADCNSPSNRVRFSGVVSSATSEFGEGGLNLASTNASGVGGVNGISWEYLPVLFVVPIATKIFQFLIT